VGVTAAITKAVVDAQGDVDSGRLTSLGGDYCIHMLVSVPETQEQAFRKEAQAAVGKFGGTHTTHCRVHLRAVVRVRVVRVRVGWAER
jgi:glycine cleavage system regulatory protein